MTRDAQVAQRHKDLRQDGFPELDDLQPAKPATVEEVLATLLERLDEIPGSRVVGVLDQYGRDIWLHRPDDVATWLKEVLDG